MYRDFNSTSNTNYENLNRKMYTYVNYTNNRNKNYVNFYQKL